MKNLKYLFIMIMTLSLGSCEDVIDVNLNTAPPKLVIDAAIVWQKGTIGNVQKVKLTTTTDYYNPVVPVVSGATVFITDSNNSTYNFTEISDTGEYLCDNFVPVLNTVYVLTVIHDGQTYTASETLKPVPPIDKIVQRNDSGFSGKDIEIKVFLTDSAPTDDYYLFRYDPSFAAVSEFDLEDDEFFQGNQFSNFYINEDMKSGDTLQITLYGISQQYYNYMTIIRSISAGGGGPFATPPAKAKGNIINTTDKANYALGYFNLSESDYKKYTVE